MMINLFGPKTFYQASDTTNTIYLLINQQRLSSGKISLKDIESNLHVNPSYFSTLFKSEMGITFTDYINSLKVEYACSLLTNSNMSIIDISLSAGFDDQSYFTKVFRKIKGMTPKQYRTSHNKDIPELL